MTPQSVKQYLNSILDELEAGKVPSRPRSPWWVRSLAGPAALSLSLGLGACAGDESDGQDERPLTECGCDALTEGTDEAVDCQSSDCDLGVSHLAVALYAVPLQEFNCEDGIDNDDDGDVDCYDVDCAESPNC